jgi:predicted ATP-dependent serine protease
MGHPPGKSIQPRLQAAGADLKRIIRIKLEESGFAADRDITRLEETLKAEPNVRLLIIDPIADMIGETNNNSASEVRQKVLNPLSKMAVKYNLCVLIVCHTNKKEGMSAINCVDGTQAYVSGVRGSWLMLPWDEDDVLA